MFMYKALIGLLLAVSLFVATSPVALAVVRVKGFVNKRGSYTPPHYRSSPNKSKLDNYSHKGNVNPFNGKVGQRR